MMDYDDPQFLLVQTCKSMQIPIIVNQPGFWTLLNLLGANAERPCDSMGSLAHSRTAKGGVDLNRTQPSQ